VQLSAYRVHLPAGYFAPRTVRGRGRVMALRCAHACGRGGCAAARGTPRGPSVGTRVASAARARARGALATCIRALRRAWRALAAAKTACTLACGGDADTACMMRPRCAARKCTTSGTARSSPSCRQAATTGARCRALRHVPARAAQHDVDAAARVAFKLTPC
jgi:hypothetical protein